MFWRATRAVFYFFFLATPLANVIHIAQRKSKYYVYVLSMLIVIYLYYTQAKIKHIHGKTEIKSKKNQLEEILI